MRRIHWNTKKWALFEIAKKALQQDCALTIQCDFLLVETIIRKPHQLSSISQWSSGNEDAAAGERSVDFLQFSVGELHLVNGREVISKNGDRSGILVLTSVNYDPVDQKAIGRRVLRHHNEAISER